MARVTISVERLSDAYLARYSVHDQEDKVMQEAAEAFGASRELSEADARWRRSNSEQDFQEMIHATRHLADEVADCMVALVGLAHMHGVSGSALRDAAARVARRNHERGRL